MKFKQQVLAGISVGVFAISQTLFGAGVTVITHGYQLVPGDLDSRHGRNTAGRPHLRKPAG